jgi:hypothetical protein
MGQDVHTPQKKKISIRKKGAVNGKSEESDKDVNQKVR